MKKKSLVLSLIFCAVAVCSLSFGLVGCDKTTPADIEKDYATFTSTVQEYTQKGLLKSGDLNQISSDFLVDYGSFVNGRVASSAYPSYQELQTRYNSMFVLSNDYITKNISYIFRLGQDELSKETKSILTQIDKNLKDYTNSFKDFYVAQTTLKNHFTDHKESSEEIHLSFLIEFKKAYGKF